MSLNVFLSLLVIRGLTTWPNHYPSNHLKETDFILKVGNAWWIVMYFIFVSTRERCRLIGRTFSHVSVVYVVPITLISSINYSPNERESRGCRFQWIKSLRLSVTQLVIVCSSSKIVDCLFVMYWSPLVTIAFPDHFLDHFPDHFQLLCIFPDHLWLLLSVFRSPPVTVDSSWRCIRRIAGNML